MSIEKLYLFCCHFPWWIGSTGLGFVKNFEHVHAPLLYTPHVRTLVSSLIKGLPSVL
jgi:hypothetical protein